VEIDSMFFKHARGSDWSNKEHAFENETNRYCRFL